MGERFRAAGYDARVTQFQGDHGVDLILTRGSETVVVQCKHHPLSTIGEPVLRDLFGAMHDLRADRGFLVTTGQVSRAARQWGTGKPIETWDGARIKDEWAVELAALSEKVRASVLPEGAAALQPNLRTGWYLYIDNQGNRGAVELPRAIGSQPALGFEPLSDSRFPRLPRTLRMRHVSLKSVEPRPRYVKRIAYVRFPSDQYTSGLVFSNPGGGQTVWKITGEYAERRDRGPQPDTGFVTMRWVPNGPG